MKRAETGRRGEDLALEHYLRAGYQLLERNSRTRFGEIDLIVHQPGQLVFVEVRTRIAGSTDPLESIGHQKARQVRRTVGGWLSANRVPAGTKDVRIDAVGVTLDSDGRLASLSCLEGVL